MCAHWQIIYKKCELCSPVGIRVAHSSRRIVRVLMALVHTTTVTATLCMLKCACTVHGRIFSHQCGNNVKQLLYYDHYYFLILVQWLFIQKENGTKLHWTLWTSVDSRLQKFYFKPLDKYHKLHKILKKLDFLVCIIIACSEILTDDRISSCLAWRLQTSALCDITMGFFTAKARSRQISHLRAID